EMMRQGRRACLPYAPENPPVFVGHYWLRGEPELLAANVACVDYSIARGGALCAYRWNGEQKLDAGNLVSVGAIS
ncbi:MAG: serine/threonine protein phosphatase, partial [Planctomycetes bacterium]|nr:serine/threonine protein phosphatase [Planctomycetota bacterium]